MAYSCEHCSKGFSTISNLNKHIRRNACSVLKERNRQQQVTKQKEAEDSIAYLKTACPTIEDVYVELVKLKEEMAEVKEQNSKLMNALITQSAHSMTGNNTTNIHNNTTINNNQIVINNFGNEDKTHLTHDWLSKAVVMMDNGIVELFRRKHFHPSKPCNRNVKLNNKKNKEIAIRKNNQWEIIDYEELMEDLYCKNTYDLDMHYTDNEDEFSMNPQKHRALDEFFTRARNNDPEIRDRVIKKMYMTLISEKNKLQH